MPGVWGVLQPRATNHASRVLPLSLLESTLAELNQNKRLYLPLESTLMKKPGEGVGPTFQLSNPKPANVPALFQLRTIHWPLTVVSYSPLIARHAKATLLQSTPCPRTTFKRPSTLPRKPGRSSWKSFRARLRFATKATKWTSSP